MEITERARVFLREAGFKEAKLDGTRVQAPGFVLVEWGSQQNRHVSVLCTTGHHATLEGYKSELQSRCTGSPDMVTLHQNCVLPGKHVCIDVRNEF